MIKTLPMMPEPKNVKMGKDLANIVVCEDISLGMKYT
jgi:hypothetical protein